MFVNDERCEKWTKLFPTLFFITSSFITLGAFHIYIKAYLCSTMLGTCTSHINHIFTKSEKGYLHFTINNNFGAKFNSFR